MTLEDALKQVLPNGAPGYITDAPSFTFEINGLVTGSMPASGEVLAQGQHKGTREGERREQFLVKTDSHLLFFRICSASADAGYDEYATGWAYPANGPEADAFIAKNRDMLERLCH